MKRRHRFTLPALLTLSLIAFGTVRADVVVLKSGERLEGKVISETSDSITVEYRLTPKIKDTKVVAKADIKEMTRLTASETEIEEKALRRIVPTPDLLTAADYEALIQDKLRPFVAKYPGTPEAAEVETIIATLSEEKQKTLSGELKVQGRWLSAAEARRDAYNIEAYRHRLAMTARAAERKDDNYLLALREFEAIRTNFSMSPHFVETVPEALELLDLYEKRLTTMAQEQPIHAKQRADGLKILQGTELQLTKSSIDAEVDAFKDRVAAQKKAKAKWVDVYKYDAPSIKDATAAVAKERTELKGLDLPALTVENNNLIGVQRLLAEDKVAEAEAQLSKIPKESVVNPKSFEALNKQITAQKDAVKKRNKAATEAAATSAATRPVTGAEGEDGKNALAELLKKGTEGKPGDPAAPAVDGKAAPAKAGDKKEEKPKAAPAAAPAPAPVEEPGFLASISDYFPIIGGAVVLILVLALFAGKKKKAE